VWSDNTERGGEWLSLRGVPCQPAFQNRKGRTCVCKHVRLSRSTCLHQMMIIAQLNHELSSASVFLPQLPHPS
jgi:hypothetical protein